MYRYLDCTLQPIFHIKVILQCRNYSFNDPFINKIIQPPVVVGSILGYIIANLVLKSRSRLEHATRSNYIWTSVFLFASALVTYFSLNLFGLDADWSVKKAFEYCQQPEWIHLSTSPLFTLMRYTGFLLGFGLGLHSNFFRQSSEFHFTFRMKLITASTSIGITKLSEMVVQPKANINLLYLFGFVMSASLGFIYSAIAPWIATKICVTNRKQVGAND